jgi:hypothetical protein
MDQFTLMAEFQAKNVLSSFSLAELKNLVYINHEDFYGQRGDWVMDANKEELLSWWHIHYTWDERYFCWVQVPEFVCG